MKKILTALFFLLLSVFPVFGEYDIYVLAAPYGTVTDSVPWRSLKRVLMGMKTGYFDTLLMSPQTQTVFGAVRSKTLQCEPAENLLKSAWNGERVYALIPFDALDPRWKVIQVDGVSPLDLRFDPEPYPLKTELPAGKSSNFDPGKLTTLTLTGTTALARQLAAKMDQKGVLMPAEKIGETLAASDITHISSESSFMEGCPADSPEQRFCSRPEYFELIQSIGTDIVELTGNHNLDYLAETGFDSYLTSLDLFHGAGMQTYGGGVNSEDARLPLKIEHHGNKLAFLGCNAMGPENAWASEDTPGAARCDMDRMKSEIAALRAEGWLPIVTLQHFEYVWYDVPPQQSHDFFELAEAGAVIVSGSQAHIPQGMTFVGDHFIHFGLGNLFFDQMSDVERTSFFDRHYFYDGRYIGNVLETIILEDYSQPRFLTEEERTAFLELIFSTCEWGKVFAQ